MSNTCKNCKYFKDNICQHQDHCGVIVASFTTCNDYDEEIRRGPFGTIKFVISEKTPDEVILRYVCEDCGKTMEEPYHWQLRLPTPFFTQLDPETKIKKEKEHGYHFWCKECWNAKN